MHKHVCVLLKANTMNMKNDNTNCISNKSIGLKVKNKVLYFLNKLNRKPLNKINYSITPPNTIYTLKAIRGAVIYFNMQKNKKKKCLVKYSEDNVGYVKSLDIVNRNDLVAEIYLNNNMRDISDYNIHIVFETIKGSSRRDKVCVINGFNIGHLLLCASFK